MNVKQANKNFPSKWLKGELKQVSKGSHVCAKTTDEGNSLYCVVSHTYHYQ